MIDYLPQRGQAKPRRLAHYDCWTWVIFQVIGAHTVFIADSDNALQAVGDQPLQDGLQFTQAATASPQGHWWKGDLWACASISNGPLLRIVPGDSGNAQVALQLDSDGPVMGQTI